jgi:hypothetical protein
MTLSIDALYGGFADGLPPELYGLALNLPHVLGLSQQPGAAWSEVFPHRITLEAPALVAEGLGQVGAELVRDAVFAHALSVIEALGTDRIADNQILRAPELLGLLKEIRRARDTLIRRVFTSGSELMANADRDMREALREERSLLSRLSAATFQDYHRISLAKQAVRFPGSVALALAARSTPGQVEQIKRMLSGVWLGLQFEDDASAWEDDWKRGSGAWAVSLARRRIESVKQQSADERPTEPDLVRRRVFKMRVLFLMLQSARHRYRSAWRHARVLGAAEIADFAAERIERLDSILPMEERHAGYVVRARKLAPWAAAVLT